MISLPFPCTLLAHSSVVFIVPVSPPSPPLLSPWGCAAHLAQTFNGLMLMCTRTSDRFFCDFRASPNLAGPMVHTAALFLQAREAWFRGDLFGALSLYVCGNHSHQKEEEKKKTRKKQHTNRAFRIRRQTGGVPPAPRLEYASAVRC